MAVLMRMEAPGATLAQYERMNEILGIAGDEDAPDGLILHMAGATQDGVVVIDVWESEEKLNSFFEERAGAALQEAGLEGGPPEISTVHNIIPKGGGAHAGVIMETRVKMDTAEYDRMVNAMPSFVGDPSQHPCTAHVAAIAADGTFYVADLWESPEAFGAFAQSEIVPVADPSMEITPSFTPAHNVIRGSTSVSA